MLIKSGLNNNGYVFRLFIAILVKITLLLDKAEIDIGYSIFEEQFFVIYKFDYMTVN